MKEVAEEVEVDGERRRRRDGGGGGGGDNFIEIKEKKILMDFYLFCIPFILLFSFLLLLVLLPH